MTRVFRKSTQFFPIFKNKTWKIFVSKILELNLGQNPFEKLSFFKIRFLIDPKTGDKGAAFWSTLSGSWESFGKQFDPLQNGENPSDQKIKK